VSKIYIVQPGDTLWSIVAASGYRGDIRAVVDQLSAAQHGQPLQVGQRIVLP
jgi:LysM repeat protein